MDMHSDKIRILPISIALSALVHLLVICPLGRLGCYNFAPPVNPLQAVMVDLEKSSDDALTVKESLSQVTGETDNDREDAKGEANHITADEAADDTPPTGALQRQVMSEPAIAATELDVEKIAPASSSNESTDVMTPTASRQDLLARAIQPPLRTAGEFLATKRENLYYQIKLLGIQAGSAELEAKNEKGEVRITLRVKSNSVISTVYPVDDLIETRHIGGNFLLTRIRQQEGTFKRDVGFTIFLRDKYVFWIDRLKNRVAREQIPNDEVLDLISGFYFLRNQVLQVGTTVMLQIYDSDVYAQVPVEVLRRELVELPGFRKADTLVVRPLLKTGGIFKSTGDVLIWLTADDYKVPVKVETQIPLGKVTAELVSAEAER